jgi:DNA-binding response OmpR family regulator
MLESCPLLQWIDVKRDDECHTILINNHLLRFSPTQYHLARLLLSATVVSDTTLSEHAFQREAGPAEKKLISKYINKIRSKFRSHGLEICRLYRYGYALVPVENKT